VLSADGGECVWVVLGGHQGVVFCFCCGHSGGGGVVSAWRVKLFVCEARTGIQLCVQLLFSRAY